MNFGMKKVGSPKSSKGDDGAELEVDIGPEKKKKGGDDFGKQGAEMAVRSLAKAFGMDPDEVDVPKATRALRAFVVSCESSEDDEDDGDKDSY